MLLSSSPLATRSKTATCNLQQNLSVDFAIEKLPQKDLVKILKSLIDKRPQIRGKKG